MNTKRTKRFRNLHAWWKRQVEHPDATGETTRQRLEANRRGGRPAPVIRIAKLKRISSKTPIMIPAAANPDDAELLVLGAQLEGMVAELPALCAWVDEVRELLEREIKNLASLPADREEWTQLDFQAYVEVRLRVEVEGKTEIGAAYGRAAEAHEALYQRMDPLCIKIRSLRPRTAKGRALKRWAHSIQCGDFENARLLIVGRK